MKNLLRLVKVCVFCICLGLLLFSTIKAQCSIPGIVEDFETLNTVFDNFKVYPSMAPRVYLKISYDSFVPPEFFNPDSMSNFVIVKSGQDCSQRLKIERLENLSGINYLVFDAKSNGLKKGDKINVGIIVERKPPGAPVQKVLKWDSDDPGSGSRREIDVKEIEKYTVKLTPDVVPDQELVDGTKKTVGQLKIKLDVPSLVTNNNFARVYFNTDNVISTNWKDKTSKLETKFGAENSLTRSWYVPANLEVKINGDQRLKNSTFVTTGGVRTILPWAWTKKGLFNQIIRAPVSPEFGLNLEFHRRLKQDAAFKAKFPNKNSFALSSQFAWLPIQLFTDRCVDDGGNRDIDKCYSARNISLEVAAKGWWFPYEKTLTGTKVRRLEGRGEVSLLIPIGNIADQFGFKKEKTGFASRVRVKYTFGANDAAGFKRSSQFTFGIEAIK